MKYDFTELLEVSKTNLLQADNGSMAVVDFAIDQANKLLQSPDGGMEELWIRFENNSCLYDNEYVLNSVIW